MGWQIVSHSFVLLFRNLADALKISIGPYLIGLVAAFAIAWASGFPLGAITGTQDDITTLRIPPDQAGGIVLGVLLIAVLMLFVSGWVAVSWHRFVLLEEYPALIPQIGGKPIGGYIGRVIVLSLLMALIFLPIGFTILSFFGDLSANSNGAQLSVIAMGITIALVGFMSWLWLRIALVLPAIAIGKPMRIRDSWQATAPATLEIFQVVAIMMILNFGVNFILERLAGLTAIGLVLNLIVTWISIMVGVSILTTLYGHLVENRSID